MSSELEEISKNIKDAVLSISNNDDDSSLSTSIYVWAEENPGLPLTKNVTKNRWKVFNEEELHKYVADNFLAIAQSSNTPSDFNSLWELVFDRVFYQAMLTNEGKENIQTAYPVLLELSSNIDPRNVYSLLNCGLKYPELHEETANYIPVFLNRLQSERGRNNMLACFVPRAYGTQNDNVIKATLPFFDAAVDNVLETQWAQISLLPKFLSIAFKERMEESTINNIFSHLQSNIVQKMQEGNVKTALPVLCHADIIALLPYGRNENAPEDLQKLYKNYTGKTVVTAMPIDAFDGYSQELKTNLMVSLGWEEGKPYFELVHQYRDRSEEHDYYELKASAETIQYFGGSCPVLSYIDHVFELLDDHAQKHKGNNEVKELSEGLKKLLILAKPYNDLRSHYSFMSVIVEDCDSPLTHSGYISSYYSFMQVKQILDNEGVDTEALIKTFPNQFPLQPPVKTTQITENHSPRISNF